MPQSNKFSYQDIADKKGIYVVIHGNVYDCTQFIKSHPGGEDVLVEVSGTDATEAFEGVGHSDEARKWLETLLLGPLKSSPGKPTRRHTTAHVAYNGKGNLTSNLILSSLTIVLILFIWLAFF